MELETLLDKLKPTQEGRRVFVLSEGKPYARTIKEVVIAEIDGQRQVAPILDDGRMVCFNDLFYDHLDRPHLLTPAQILAIKNMVRAEKRKQLAGQEA